MKKLFSISVFVIFFFCLYAQTPAEVPQIINYQGKLTTATGALIVDTTVTMEFKIYDDSIGGTILWQETQNSVKVENGIFSVLLGSINPIPDSVFNGLVRYLGVTVGSDPEMTPRKPIVSAGNAFRSKRADAAEYADNAQYADTANFAFNCTSRNGFILMHESRGSFTNTSQQVLDSHSFAAGEFSAGDMVLIIAFFKAPNTGKNLDYSYWVNYGFKAALFCPTITGPSDVHDEVYLHAGTADGEIANWRLLQVTDSTVSGRIQNSGQVQPAGWIHQAWTLELQGYVDSGMRGYYHWSVYKVKGE